jgi:indole-3-glycerol phosphate synthase
VTLAPPRRAARTGKRGVVFEIAERRRRDVLAEVEATSLGDQLDRALATPAPRPIVGRLTQPGLHLVAEIKRASPSAGRIAQGNEDILARARAYAAGGATAISVLCEPHWFGGSVDDLHAVRAAVSIPVLAKEFVVEDIQLPMLRAAGADLVLLLAVLHPPKRLARLVERALAIGLEPLVEAHDEKELRAALATDARLIGLNNRDLRTLEVDPTRADRLRSLVPDDRLVIAESGVRDPSVAARWRAIGFDAALVGEALMRSADPVAAVRSFVGAGRAPDDPANVARRAFVKICGVTDADGVLAAVGAGADAIGLNLAAESPRRLALGEAAELARLVRVAARKSLQNACDGPLAKSHRKPSTPRSSHRRAESMR